MVNHLPMHYPARVHGQPLGAATARPAGCPSRATPEPHNRDDSKQTGRNSALRRTLRVSGAQAGITEMDDNTA
jgi:hypothetical protein